MPEQPEWNAETFEKAAEQEQPKEEAKEAVETPEPTETPDPDPEVQEKVQTQKVVSHRAFHQERERRKEFQAMARQMQEQNAFLAKQVQELSQRMQPQVQAPGPDDPVGQIQHGVKTTQEEIRQLREERARELQSQNQQQQMRVFVQSVREADAAFKEQQPDSHDAIAHLRKGMMEEFKAQGASHAQAVEAITQEELRMAWAAQQQGDNPSEVAYNRAVARGYTPAARKLQMQKEGQQTALPTGAGGKSGGLPSLEALVKMPGKQFAKATEGDKWQELMKKHM